MNLLKIKKYIYFKNCLVKKTFNVTSSTICNFCGRRCHISKYDFIKDKNTNSQEPKKIWALPHLRNSTIILECENSKRF